MPLLAAVAFAVFWTPAQAFAEAKAPLHFRDSPDWQSDDEPAAEGRVTSRMFITTCKAVNYRVILTQLVTF